MLLAASKPAVASCRNLLGKGAPATIFGASWHQRTRWRLEDASGSVAGTAWHRALMRPIQPSPATHVAGTADDGMMPSRLVAA